MDQGIVELAKAYAAPHPLALALQAWVGEIAALDEGESLDLRPADYFYRLLALDPFAKAVKNENAARNLAIFSQLLNVFQSYYHYTVVTHRNREFLRFHLFNSFLRLLHDGGINEYEDPDQPFPKGHVQVMTIHQAKGLEFPVVVVGSLSTQLSSAKQIDRDLGPSTTGRPSSLRTGSPSSTGCACTTSPSRGPRRCWSSPRTRRPRTTLRPSGRAFRSGPTWRRTCWRHSASHCANGCRSRRAYSFTGDLKIYETCPRQYQFFREYDFTPSRSAVIFFGLLVHQTIEEIHRIALDGKLDTLDEPRIRELFDRTFRFLCLSDVRPIGDAARESAFRQVMNYFRQNQDEMRRVIQTEVDVSLEKDGYILTGKVDLLLGGDGKLELLDFKTSPRPTDSPALLAAYERQLCTYAHILERRYGKRVDRLLLYWTAEEQKDKALMAFPYRPERIDEAGRYFDQVVARIQARGVPGHAAARGGDLQGVRPTDALPQRETSSGERTDEEADGEDRHHEDRAGLARQVQRGRHAQGSAAGEPALPGHRDRQREPRHARGKQAWRAGRLFDVYEGKEGDTFEAGWRNKLIWGDNLLVMGSLLEKFAGKIDLIYIDPPFATGADFSFTTESATKGLEIEKETIGDRGEGISRHLGRGIQFYTCQ